MHYMKKLKRFWKFLWDDDSALSWVLNVAIAFVVIKYLVYPGLGFVLGTDFPVVAVVSGSMEHDGSFDDWWSSRAVCADSRCTQEQWYREKGISEDEFTNFIFNNGFNKGDIIILFGSEAERVEVGDVIVFASTEAYPIIHRVVEVNEGSFETKGDHNPMKGPVDVDIKPEQLLGKAVFRVPYLGWIKIAFVCGVNTIAKGSSFGECMVM